MNTNLKAFMYGVITLGLIYIIGFLITLLSQSILNNLEFNLGGLILIIILLLFYKIIPFIPFLLITFFICRYLITRLRLSFALVLPILCIIFLIYGRVIWKGEFLHLYQLDRANYTLRDWWKSETSDWHFNIASFLATIFFVWITFYKKDKTRSGKSELVNTSTIET